MNCSNEFILVSERPCRQSRFHNLVGCARVASLAASCMYEWVFNIETLEIAAVGVSINTAR